ncbi:sensor histidine kinase [Domibacillus sp. DTU_2020_1001157_1_SI_ALB_TIR_016]|uniref:sensor histidine kinase n=1 Tax=Domibacillus sp. DTU_2020_1001157_1_SI_ALB_TIR_016 TaxID=3077789 RepID=UPI0028E54F34|nr:sensor histidine kinase [Domibacillus sp. DTU_2020_1001157_1_SI_ALB_TIR_016]WNS80562.1 sensor histidine kinase [Domibacillus sp. DTU_2020_1001157_1_SI_ALB_TIR_016]
MLILWRRPKLLGQMIGLISMVVFLTILFVSAIFFTLMGDLAEKSLGSQAMTVAKMAAQNETIIQAFDDPNPPLRIQPIAESIRQSTGAGYVVIGNKHNVRYSHHITKHIGKKMGTSSRESLSAGKSVVYKGTGISGSAIKAKAPIYNKKGEIIGVASVGFLTTEVDKARNAYWLKLLCFTLFISLFGITGAVTIAKRVKKLIFNLEPEEISFLFKEKEATLESIRDATIAVNNDHHITSINKRARNLLEGQISEKGKITNSRLVGMAESIIDQKTSIVRQRFLFGHQLYVADGAPIWQNNQTKGAVLTIRPVSEIEKIEEEMSAVKSITDNIRAQNHEYLNKLNTIYGLIVLEQYDEARSFIADEVKERQDVVVFLTSSVKDPYIAACLLGKIHRSKEMKVHFQIDEDSNLSVVPSSFDTKLFVTVLGNMIDNAMEAAVRLRGDEAVVRVSFTDIGHELIFDIEDNGPGIPLEEQDRIFEEGFTTKDGDNHGIGLAIVKNTLQKLKGDLYLSKSSFGGAQFTITIPKA